MYLPNSSSLYPFVFTLNDKRLRNTLNCDDSEYLLINMKSNSTAIGQQP